MKYPFIISSDQHLHNWTQFASVTTEGINSRLQIILDEIAYSYKALKEYGGDTMFLAGDLFHTRGEIKPSVFNPAVQAFEDAGATYPGVQTWALPGNHDLEDRDTTYLGNAMQALSQIDHFNVCLEPTVVGDVVVFPWYPRLDDLREAMREYARADRDAIIHAPVNGVLKGIPDHGLEAGELAAMGYRRVFSGHYHNHLVMEGGKVISIGATTHQTWNDPGTKAGFIMVWEDRVLHIPSVAPKFVVVDLERVEDADDLASQVSGNYAKLALQEASAKDVAQFRQDILDAGALGVIVTNTPKSSAPSRKPTNEAGKAPVSIGASVEEFIKGGFKTAFPSDVSKMAQEILSEVA